MTVAELIVRLQTFPLDWDVEVLDGASMEIGAPFHYLEGNAVQIPLYDFKYEEHIK